MNRYFCVFRMAGARQPSSCSFDADSVRAAIEGMMKAANVNDTTMLEEFEILHVMENRNYKRVASKIVDDKNPPTKQESVAVAPPKVETKKKEETPAPSESVYCGYTIQQL